MSCEVLRGAIESQRFSRALVRFLQALRFWGLLGGLGGRAWGFVVIEGSNYRVSEDVRGSCRVLI